MDKKGLLRFGVVLASLFWIVTTVESIVSFWQSGDKITERVQRLTFLKADQADLLRRKRELEGVDYVERVARDELGLSKPGEEQVIIPPDLLLDTSSLATPAAFPNWKKWVSLIF